jgi:hypothetical protein
MVHGRHAEISARVKHLVSSTQDPTAVVAPDGDPTSPGRGTSSGTGGAE